MANLRIKWALPTTRESGKPLNPADIDRVEIDLSADEGGSWVQVGSFGPDTLETLVSDVDYGNWLVRGVVVDVAERRSNVVVAAIMNEDTTPPGELTLTLGLE